MQFTKMQGAGNDFIIIDNTSGSLSEDALPELAKKLCTPHISIGADGLMVVEKARNGGDYAMRFYNSDGSVGEMCGNGARCIARYGYEKGLAGETQKIETTAGLVIGQRLEKNIYKVRLNDPSLIELHYPASADGVEYDCAYVVLGDPGIPHAVLLYPDFDRVNMTSLYRLGMELRWSSAFPKGANVSFVKLLGRDKLKVLTFERGVEDFTLACGTGCGSAAAAMTLMGLVSGRDVKLQNMGGELSVSLTAQGDTVHDIFLSGPASLVCQGEFFDE